MKKLVTLLLVVIMSLAPLVSDARSFTDVPDSHWAYDAISYFSDSGTIVGVGNDMFVPNEFISREEFAKLISEIYAKTSSGFAAQTFSDVTPDMWSYNYIESVKEYLTGYPQNGEPFFNPKGKAAREDVAYALVKIIGLDKLSHSEGDILGRFEDSNEISYHLKDYVAIAVSGGLMQGYENQLRPQDGITRAETAALLFRAIKKPVAGVEQPSEDITNNTEPEQSDEHVTEPDGYSIETTSIKQIAGYKEDAIKGTVTLEYNPEENKASFLAKMKCYNGPFEYVDCEIELKNATSVTENEIKGTFWLTGKKKSFEGTISVADGVLTLTTPTDNIDLIAHYGSGANEDIEPPEKEEVQESAPEKETLAKIEYKKKRNSIAATKIYSVEITKSGENNMKSNKNIDGYMQVSFGDDAIEDTEFVAEFAVGGDRYYIESDTILGYNHSTKYGESVTVRLTYDMYKNDKLIAEDVRNSISMNKANDAFELGGSALICAETLDWNIDTLPDNPEVQKEVSPWEGASSVYASISELAGEKASGMMSLRYKIAESLAEANIELTSGEAKYAIELAKLDEITADKITAKFKISLNGQTVAENVTGEISGYSGKLKDTLSFECDYENLAIAGMIVEVGN